jgi:hypothetical protein
MPRWVTQDTGRCPRSGWNTVRHQRGTGAAITAECLPPSNRNGFRNRTEYAVKGLKAVHCGLYRPVDGEQSAAPETGQLRTAGLGR